jgi:hypothetical protein
VPKASATTLQEHYYSHEHRYGAWPVPKRLRSHHEEWRFLGCDAVWLFYEPTFRSSVPPTPSVVMIEAICSSETSVLTTDRHRRHTLEDDILHKHEFVHRVKDPVMFLFTPQNRDPIWMQKGRFICPICKNWKQVLIKREETIKIFLLFY